MRVQKFPVASWATGGGESFPCMFEKGGGFFAYRSPPPRPFSSLAINNECSFIPGPPSHPLHPLSVDQDTEAYVWGLGFILSSAPIVLVIQLHYVLN